MIGYVDYESGEFIRYDANQCHPPNKPCGNACFPPEKKCGVGEKAKQIAKGAFRDGFKSAAKGARRGATFGAVAGGAVGGLNGALENQNNFAPGSTAITPNEDFRAARAANVATSAVGGGISGALVGAEKGALIGAGYGLARGAVKAAKKFKKQDSEDCGGSCGGDCGCKSCKNKKKKSKTDSLDGYFRVDSVVSYVDHSGYTVNLARIDADQCQPPNKPCGKACFPPGKKCNVGLAKKIAKRVAVGAAVAGAGGAAFASRDRIKQGVNNVRSEVKFRKLEGEARDLDKAFTRDNPYRG